MSSGPSSRANKILSKNKEGREGKERRNTETHRPRLEGSSYRPRKAKMSEPLCKELEGPSLELAEGMGPISIWARNLWNALDWTSF